MLYNRTVDDISHQVHPQPSHENLIVIKKRTSTNETWYKTKTRQFDCLAILGLRIIIIRKINQTR